MPCELRARDSSAARRVRPFGNDGSSFLRACDSSMTCGFGAVGSDSARSLHAACSRATSNLRAFGCGSSSSLGTFRSRLAGRLRSPACSRGNLGRLLLRRCGGLARVRLHHRCNHRRHHGRLLREGHDALRRRLHRRRQGRERHRLVGDVNHLAKCLRHTLGVHARASGFIGGCAGSRASMRRAGVGGRRIHWLGVEHDRLVGSVRAAIRGSAYALRIRVFRFHVLSFLVRRGTRGRRSTLAPAAVGGRYHRVFSAA